MYKLFSLIIINILGRNNKYIGRNSSGHGHDMLILLINILGRIVQVRVMTC